jgi:hypothetical protein
MRTREVYLRLAAVRFTKVVVRQRRDRRRVPHTHLSLRYGN